MELAILSGKLRKISRFLATARVVFCVCLLSENLFADEEPSGIFFGDIRGYFEPCGCDPKTDLGGISRLSGLISRERRADPHLLIASLGNNFEPAKNEQNKDKWIASALASLKIDATLYNKLEIQRRASIVANLRPEKMSYVISNWSKPRPKNVRPLILVRGIEIYGFVDPTGWAAPDELIKVDRFLAETINSRHPKSVKSHSNARILLYSGELDSLKKISESEYFNLIVTSNSQSIDKKDVRLGKIEDSELVMFSEPIRIYMVPYGGQGVLRFGSSLGRQVKSLGELISGKECKPDIFSNACQPSPILSASRVSWLDASHAEASTINTITAKFEAERSKEFEELTKIRSKTDRPSPYVGAESCKSCHQSAYDVWSISKHARAYSALVNQKKDRDAECVNCHVAGFNSGNGFIDFKVTPQLANVQCENCHGPRRDHIANPTIKSPAMTMTQCESCHHGQHSPDFDAKEFWLRIQHGKN